MDDRIKARSDQLLARATQQRAHRVVDAGALPAGGGGQDHADWSAVKALAKHRHGLEALDLSSALLSHVQDRAARILTATKVTSDALTASLTCYNGPVSGE